MSPILEILFSLTITTVGVVLGYRAGFKQGYRSGVLAIDIDFLKNIQLPTSDEVKRQVESKL